MKDNSDKPSMDMWVVCLNCNFRRHGSNSPMLKQLHQERFKGHICEIRFQGEGEHVPFPCKDCGVFHSHYDLQVKH